MLSVTVLTLLVFIALSLPIAVVLGTLGVFLDLAYSPLPLQRAFGEVFWHHSKDFILVAVPLFIMMGEIILRAGIANRMYAAIVQWLAWLPGGLMHANIGASALFAATSGSSLATAATIGVTALPQVEKRGYSERLFLGSLAAGGSLGILIPPSMNMIIYGFLTNTSIPQLFLAGIIPGITLAALYMLVILVCCLIRPAWGGQPEITRWEMRIRTLPDLLPPIGLFILVVGSIYAGFATPTEAAALGVIGALVLAAWNRTLSWRMLGEVMEGTIRTSAMVTLILMCAFILNFSIAAIGLVTQVNDFILGLGWSPLGTMLFIIGVYIVMGMIMDALAMVVLTVPIIAPVVVSLGYDPVWFGVMIVLVCEGGMMTPPIGMVCYVIQGIRGKGSMNDVFIGITPFLLALAVMVFLMLAYPQFSLWLPTTFYR
jgi:tripartite ATP-independent transporter DctM subunit